MTILDEYRAKYPGQLDDVSDRDLAEALRNKFSPDTPPDEWHQKVGTQFTAPEVKRDALLSAGTGLAHIPSHIPGILGDLWDAARGIDTWMGQHPLPGGNVREPNVPERKDSWLGQYTPGSEDIQDIASGLTGVKLHQPETPVGDVLETGADVVGSMVGPGGTTKVLGLLAKLGKTGKAAETIAANPKVIAAVDELENLINAKIAAKDFDTAKELLKARDTVLFQKNTADAIFEGLNRYIKKTATKAGIYGVGHMVGGPHVGTAMVAGHTVASHPLGREAAKLATRFGGAFTGFNDWSSGLPYADQPYDGNNP